MSQGITAHSMPAILPFQQLPPREGGTAGCVTIANTLPDVVWGDIEKSPNAKRLQNWQSVLEDRGISIVKGHRVNKGPSILATRRAPKASSKAISLKPQSKEAISYRRKDTLL